ncbi:uncharacterized protein [Clytia hemisphaerica]|uniref:uncharacterized protein n=1 Tax=Clytia hemisphaerica TaxID=252671 RepID=UPI0034D3AEDD
MDDGENQQTNQPKTNQPSTSMATLREHIHVFKIEIKNYSKALLLILLVDFTLLCTAALCLFEIEECGDNENPIPQPIDRYRDSQSTTFKVCDKLARLNATTDSAHLKTDLHQICQNFLEKTPIVNIDIDRIQCSLSWLKFTKWFYYTNSISKALGQTPQITLSGKGKVFVMFYNVIAITLNVTTYIVGSMFTSTAVKICIYAFETHVLKRNAVLNKQTKFCFSILVLFIIFWLILAAFFETIFIDDISSFSEACFQTMSEIMLIGHQLDIFGHKEPWEMVNQKPVAYGIYILLHYVEMSLLLLLLQEISVRLISKRSGLCCIAKIYNARKKYSVTCPKCLMVEKELEQIEKMKQLQESAA